MGKFACRRCGWCCRNLTINVSYSDIIRWFNMGRNDILHEVSFIDNYPKNNTGGFYIAKTVFAPKQQCPFLENNVCEIYETRPLSCKDFPLGHKNEPSCEGSKGFCFSKTVEAQIKQKQSRDFRIAHNNRKLLLKILVVARSP